MHKFKVSEAGIRLVTFDGQIVEMFIKKEPFTYRYHIDLIESVEIEEKKFQTLFILKDKPKQKLGMEVVVDDDQRAAADALVAAVNQALLERGS
jgi:hypothetical protein